MAKAIPTLPHPIVDVVICTRLFRELPPKPCFYFPLQAAADVKVLDRHGALKFIQSSKGCLVRDLTAAYPAAPNDLAKLKAEGLIWVLPSAEKEQEAVFAAEKPPLISVSTDFVKLWHQVEVSLLLDLLH